MLVDHSDLQASFFLSLCVERERERKKERERIKRKKVLDRKYKNVE